MNFPCSYSKIKFCLVAFYLIFNFSWSQAEVSPCSQLELKVFESTLDAVDHPISSLVANARINESCKVEILINLAGALGDRVNLGFCQKGWCESLEAGIEDLLLLLPHIENGLCQDSDDELNGETQEFEFNEERAMEVCEVNPDYIDDLERIDAQIGEAARIEIEALEKKISEGKIPVCLMPARCSRSVDKACHLELMKEWWMPAVDQSFGREHWLREGSFTYLLFADAPSCYSGRQDGDTCAFYSGASLSGHYCSSPRYNPSASRDSCSMTVNTSAGPYSCMLPAELKSQAHQLGLWDAVLCEDSQDSSTCAPASSNPGQDDEAMLEQVYENNQCNIPNPPNRDRCDKINALLVQVRKASAAKVLPAGYVARHPAASLTGGTGISLDDLSQVYKGKGYRIIYFMPDQTGWREIVKSVQAGHPVQINFNPKDWATYPGIDMGHAVVMEGHWQDPDGQNWVMIRDSNDPDFIKVMGIREAYGSFMAANSGAVGLCIPTDTRPQCGEVIQDGWRANQQ